MMKYKKGSRVNLQEMHAPKPSSRYCSALFDIKVKVAAVTITVQCGSGYGIIDVPSKDAEKFREKSRSDNDLIQTGILVLNRPILDEWGCGVKIWVFDYSKTLVAHRWPKL